MTVWAGLIALGLGLGASLFLPVPQNLKTSFDAGQSLYALGEYEGAIIEYSKIVEFKSRAVRTDSVRVNFGDELELPVVAAAWYQLGNAYKKKAASTKRLSMPIDMSWMWAEYLTIFASLSNFRSQKLDFWLKNGVKRLLNISAM